MEPVFEWSGVAYPWFVFVIASPMFRHVFKLVITKFKDINLEVYCEGSERQKKSQVQAQINDKCYPTEFLPGEKEKQNRNNL